jgi:hypothetical protein
MTAEPELIHTADIPDGNDEVQETLMSRLENASTAAKKRPKSSRARKGSAKDRAESLAPSGMLPVLQQLPRPYAPRDARGRLLKGAKLAKGQLWREVQRYAETHAFEAIDFLVQVMRDPLTKTQDRLIATQMLLDRGLGKVVELTEMEVTTNKGDAKADTQVLIIAGQKVKF